MLYIFHCTKCHHEWQSVNKISNCDWCSAEGFILDVNHEWDGFYKLDELLNKIDEIP